MSARALWMTGPGELELREERLPPTGPRDARVRALASGISHGTEMLVYRGQVSPDLPLDLPTLRGSFGFPIKYGYASVGKVVEVGGEVADLSAGDLVFVHHPHQSAYIVGAERAIRLSTGLDPLSGVFLANVETAVNVILDAQPRLGERVVIFGQGVVGLIITQLLRRAGAELVVAVDPIPGRRDLSRTLGADVALSPTDRPAEAIRELTGGVGADLAIEASGNPGALDEAIQAVAFEGTVVVCSWYGTKTVPVSLGGAFHRGRIHLVSSQVGAVDAALQPRWSPRRRVALACDLLRRLTLMPLITHRIPFERAAMAYALVDERPEETVQVALTYG
jgi:2-desacetyl-2-hydroxyethyl bacteriochlorophyllide A dehydrogenase